MKLLNILMFMISLSIIIVMFKQYLIIWITLERVGLKIFKYLVPLSEVFLLLFYDSLFLVPSVTLSLILIYKYNILGDNEFIQYYDIKEDKFNINKKQLLIVFLLSPILFIIVRWTSHIINDFFSNKLFISYNMDYLDEIVKKVGNQDSGKKIILNYMKQFIDYMGLFGVTCILAPIVEEFTFRVLLYRSWLKNIFNKRIRAVLVSAIVFSLSHLDLNALVYTFIMGIILCFVYDGFGYIGSVVLHMLFNMYTFFIYYGVKIEEKSIIVLSVLIIFLMFYIIVKKSKVSIIKR